MEIKHRNIVIAFFLFKDSVNGTEWASKGIEIYRMNEGSRLILSGGYEADGTVTCDAMAAYAAEQGVPEEDILDVAPE